VFEHSIAYLTVVSFTLSLIVKLFFMVLVFYLLKVLKYHTFK